MPNNNLPPVGETEIPLRNQTGGIKIMNRQIKKMKRYQIQMLVKVQKMLRYKKRKFLIIQKLSLPMIPLL